MVKYLSDGQPILPVFLLIMLFRTGTFRINLPTPGDRSQNNIHNFIITIILLTVNVSLGLAVANVLGYTACFNLGLLRNVRILQNSKPDFPPLTIYKINE